MPQENRTAAEGQKKTESDKHCDIKVAVEEKEKIGVNQVPRRDLVPRYLVGPTGVVLVHTVSLRNQEGVLIPVLIRSEGSSCYVQVG
mmetsp:Transcript_6011/g.8506  ORF Transcript_6011/g.8506 Transcript_6011/m.8506 type:complete len:87 (-) Transcript_6011:1440-1700(-)